MSTNQPNQNPTPATPNTQPTNILPTTQSPLQPTPKKKTPWVLISLVVLLFSSTGVLGYKYYQVKQQLDNQQSTIQPSPQLVVSSPSPVVSPTPEVDPTANWKTYSNSIHDISFKYPQSWSITEQVGQKEGNQVYNTKIELTKNEAKIIMYLNMDGIGGKGQTYDGEKFVLDGIDLYQYTKSNSHNNTQTIGLSNSLTNTLGVFRINDITYSITLNYPDSYLESQSSSLKKEFNQILSSFEFTK